MRTSALSALLLALMVLSACSTSQVSDNGSGQPLDIKALPERYQKGCAGAEGNVTPEMSQADAKDELAVLLGDCRDLQHSQTRYTNDYLADLAGKLAAERPRVESTTRRPGRRTARPRSSRRRGRGRTSRRAARP